MSKVAICADVDEPHSYIVALRRANSARLVVISLPHRRVYILCRCGGLGFVRFGALCGSDIDLRFLQCLTARLIL